MKIQIKSRWNAEVIFETEAVSVKACLEIATGNRMDASGADLKGADLKGADLKGAYLEGAYLEGAYLKGADLKGAYLKGADLEGAYLEGAYLKGAYLEGADLKGADLKGADLKGAYLEGAYLEGADLKGAYLKGAYLEGADLKGAYLEGAYLEGAYLEGADLKGAYLEGAYLQPIRDDLWAVLSSAPSEVEGLRLAVLEGRIDGSTYTGTCACLVGTIANIRKCDYMSLGALKPNSGRPAERFFLGIKKGDTPENSQFSKIALEWMDLWLHNMKSAFSEAK